MNCFSLQYWLSANLKLSRKFIWRLYFEKLHCVKEFLTMICQGFLWFWNYKTFCSLTLSLKSLPPLETPTLVWLGYRSSRRGSRRCGETPWNKKWIFDHEMGKFNIVCLVFPRNTVELSRFARGFIVCSATTVIFHNLNRTPRKISSLLLHSFSYWFFLKKI